MRRRHPVRPLVATAGVLALGLVGCAGTPASSPTTSSSPSSDRCERAVTAIVDATQTYVDSFAASSSVGASASPSPEASSSTPTSSISPDTRFQQALGAAREALTAGGCDSGATRDALEAGLSSVSTQGPVAAAVLRQLTAGMTGDAAESATAEEVTPTDDLLAAVAGLPAGSTLVLGAGTYRLEEPLVLLASLTIRGAGAGTTTIESSAQDYGILAIADGRITLHGVTVRHTGTAPANAVLAGPTATVEVTESTLRGGVPRKDGTGGAGILMFDPATEHAGTATTLEATGSTFVDNGSAGVVLTGGNVASIESSTFRGNDQCGICFLDASTGSVRDGTFRDNGVGIAATGTSSPTVVGGATRGGEVGVQAADEAAPVVKDLTIRSAKRAAMIWTGRATGAVDGVRCVDVPFGLVVGEDVAPTLRDTDCAVAPQG